MRKVSVNLLLSLLVFCLLWSAVSAQTAEMTYTVKQGDTIWKIAKNHGISMDALLECNPEVKNEKDLKVGMVLMIPCTSEEFIPVDREISETHTLVVHGSGSKTASQSDNVIYVDGKSVKVPMYQAPKPVAKSEPKVVGVNNQPNKNTTVATATSYDSSNYRNKYSNMSSRSLPKANAIVKAAFSFRGVPYVFGGTTPRGFDCSGFVQYVYRMNGIKTPRMAHHQYYAGTPINRSQLRPGDLVFFETYTKGISHVGIYIGNNQFIHASSSGAVRVNELKGYYIERYRGAARYY